jgi:hypothetical protein
MTGEPQLLGENRTGDICADVRRRTPFAVFAGPMATSSAFGAAMAQHQDLKLLHLSERPRRKTMTAWL